jgi:hypothetical protein
MLNGVHGGIDIYRTKAGVLYIGGPTSPARSKDNGMTWEQVTSGLPSANYYSVQGDGKYLYTCPSAAIQGTYLVEPYFTSLESDGATWAPYASDSRTFTNGPYRMRFDPANQILYSANWDAGIWALKVLP